MEKPPPAALSGDMTPFKRVVFQPSTATGGEDWGRGIFPSLTRIVRARNPREGG